MRSIAVATVWEFWRRAWAPLAMVLSIGIGLPALVFAVLPTDVPFSDPAMLGLQFFLNVFHLFTLCCVLCGVQTLGPGLGAGTPRRLYQLPLATWSLVAGQMLCGMVAAMASYLIIVCVLNALFPLDWPLWGPALVAAAVYACVQAAVWSPTRIPLLQLAATTAVAALLFFWVKSKFGPIWDSVQHSWAELSTVELVALVGLVVASFAVAVWSISRDRAGDTLTWFALSEWLDRPASAGGRGPAFRNAQRAQFWYEWRQKGLIMPAIYVFFSLVMLVGYQIGGARRIDLVHAVQAYGMGLIIIGAILGLILGSANLTAKGRGECGPFLGTRPSTDTELATAILKVAAASLLTTWGLWLLSALAATIWLWSHEREAAAALAWQHLLERASGPRWPLFFCGTLLLAWASLAALVPLTMTGRHRLVFSFYTLVPLALAGWLTVVKLMLPAEYVEATQLATVYLVSTLVVAGIVAAVWMAVRRGHISSRSVWLAAALWVVAGPLLMAITYPVLLRDPLAATLTGTIWAVAISPWATAPLAMSWNRHR